jgi:hypothetical protein
MILQQVNVVSAVITAVLMENCPSSCVDPPFFDKDGGCTFALSITTVN